MKFRSIVSYLCVALIALLVVGCGGGSEGTGGSVRSFQGTVKSPDGSPVADAQVTILSTGDTSTTDAQGVFAMQTTDLSSTLQIEVTKDSTALQATVSSLTEDTTTIQVTIEFDPSVDVISVSHLDVDVKIVGICDPYFENNGVIRQANPVPYGQRCTVKVVTRSNGVLTGNISYALQYGNCAGTGPKTVLGAGLTSVAYNPGVGQINFPYIDDEKHCLYEVVVPYKATGSDSPIIYRIETFTLQSHQ